MKSRRNLAGASRVLVLTALAPCIFGLSDAQAGSYAKWQWDTAIPKAYQGSGLRSKRTAKMVDELFRTMGPPSLEKIIGALGQPEALSYQRMWTLREGSAKPADHITTLQFLLDDGGEAQVQVYDVVSVIWATRFDAKGHGHLLYK